MTKKKKIITIIKKLKIIYKEEGWAEKIYKMKIIPEISDYSDIYTDSYHPKYLFTKDDYYYCSGNGNNHFIEFDFSKEYYFIEVKITFSEKYKSCKPKICKIQIFDMKKRLTQETKFVCELEDKYICMELFKVKARYIKFIFTENLGGGYIVIKKMEFYRYNLASIE